MFARRRKLTLTQSVHRSVWPRTGWKRAFFYFWKRIVRLSASPHAVAAGAAAGAFSSFTPLVGFHFILSFALAFLVRGNMLAAALGTAIGNPLTVPLILGLNYEVGHWILSGGEDPIVHAAASPVHATGMSEAGLLSLGYEQLWPILKPMLVGAVPLGLAAAGITYVAVFNSVRAVQRRRRMRREGALASLDASSRPT